MLFIIQSSLMFLHLETGLFFLRSNTFSGGKGYLQFLHKVQRSNSYLCGLCMAVCIT